ncbi:MAG: phage integrase SAM-like domain-containing protein [Bacteroidales bacterium]|nr:phage integrase SAM-like domain-containing protein [Bacteroidales bacterium]
MATIVYSLSKKKDKITGKQEILMRFFHGRFNQRAKTNLFTYIDYWDEKGQCNKIPKIRFMSEEKTALIKNLQQVNKDLEDISTFIQEEFIKMGAGKIEFPDKWLSSKLLDRINIPKTEMKVAGDSATISTLEHFIEVHDISESQKRQYKVLRRALQRFSLYTRISIELDDLTADTLRRFADYLSTEYIYIGKDSDGKPCIIDSRYQEVYDKVPESRFPKPRGKNDIIGTMSRFRTFVKWAKRNHLTNNDPFDEYEMGQPVYGTPFFITKEERNQLYAAKFPKNPGLEIQRDIFVFHCFIGCRVGDLLQMKKSNVINGAIEYVPRKTKEGRPITVRVPLGPTAMEILERYPDVKGDRLLPFTCAQDYNRNIKKMLRLAGIDRKVTVINSLTREEEQHPIWEVASSHMARRVLIGNLYRELKDPNLIAKISGHVENSKAFNRYRNIDEEMAKEVIMKLE